MGQSSIVVCMECVYRSLPHFGVVHVLYNEETGESLLTEEQIPRPGMGAVQDVRYECRNDEKPYDTNGILTS